MLVDRNMPPMEADAAYQGCLPSCELHSRSLDVGRTDACDLEIAYTCYVIPRLPAQSRDSENAQRNLEIAQILRLHGTYTCTLNSFMYGFVPMQVPVVSLVTIQ